MSSSLDVVIVAFNNGADIGRCVTSAYKLSSVGRVVVVNHGEGGATEVAAAAGAEVVSDPTNPGFGAGQNRGIKLTDAPYVLVLNPDAIPDPEGIAGGVHYLDIHPEVAAVQGGIINSRTGRAERSQGRAIAAMHLWGRAIGARRLLALPVVRRTARHLQPLQDHVERIPSSPTPVAYLAATALLVRRAAFDEVGGFDESYFLYGEDLDLCGRLRYRGWTLVALPDHWARHKGGGSAKGWWERETSWWEGTMRYAAAWWSGPRWLLALGAAMLRWIQLAVARPRGAGTAWRRVIWTPLRSRARNG